MLFTQGEALSCKRVVGTACNKRRARLIANGGGLPAAGVHGVCLTAPRGVPCRHGCRCMWTSFRGVYNYNMGVFPLHVIMLA